MIVPTSLLNIILWKIREGGARNAGAIRIRLCEYLVKDPRDMARFEAATISRRSHRVAVRNAHDTLERIQAFDYYRW